MANFFFSGKRSRPKRQFIMPALRQAAPVNSQFIEPVSELIKNFNDLVPDFLYNWTKSRSYYPAVSSLVEHNQFFFEHLVVHQ
jgi:hypothetical protein